MTRTTAWWIGAATLLLMAVVLVLRTQWSAVGGALVLAAVMGGFGFDDRHHRRP